MKNLIVFVILTATILFTGCGRRESIEERAEENGWLDKPFDYEEMMQDLWEDWMVKPYPESEAVVEALNECLEYNKQRLAESKQPLT